MTSPTNCRVEGQGVEECRVIDCPNIPCGRLSPLAELFLTTDKWSATSQELEKCFFDCLRHRNGVYKTTYAHRLDDVNAWVAKYLPPVQPLRLLDVAISSGTSTLEWVELLEQSKLDYHMTGNDLTINGLLVSFGARMHAVLDHTKWPLLFEIKGRWVSYPPRKRHLVRYFVPIALIKAALFVWSYRYAGLNEGQTQQILGMRSKTRTISLVTPRLMKHPRVTVCEGNILAKSSLHGAFDVIRAANILNRKYFDDDSLKKILSNLRQHLSCNGILIVCRTDTDEKAANRATIFNLNERNRFVVMSQLNGGSEIEDLIVDFPNS